MQENTRMQLSRLLIVLAVIFSLGQSTIAQEPEKIFFDKDWKTTTQPKAMFYRLITLDKNGVPMGKVRDYYITGELQWEGVLRSFDRTNDNNNVSEGVCTWFYRSGKKQEEKTYVNGKIEGRSTEWYESGKVSREIDYVNNLAHGLWIEYFEGGNTRYRAEFKNGKVVGKWATQCDDFGKCQQVLREGFATADNDHGFSLTNTAQIVPQKGVLVKGDKESSLVQTMYMPLDVTRNFSIETSVIFQTGNMSTGNGLVFGRKNWDDYYYFYITPSGYYRVGAVTDGVNVDFAKWTWSDNINRGKNNSNVLKITRSGENVIYSINKQVVHIDRFYRLAGNDIGFFTGYEQKTVLYEYIEVRRDAEGSKNSMPAQSAAGQKWRGGGTGFIIDRRGYIATNYHVIENASEIEIEVVRNGQKVSHKAKVIASDKQNDLSILQIDDTTFKPYTALSYNLLTRTSDVGTNIFSLGYPLTMIMGDEMKFTDGKISSKTGFQGDITTYQISVPVQPGSSGGPLFDYDGNLVGVVNAKIMALDNVSYAIKSSYLTNLIDVLPEKLELPRDTSLTAKPLTEKIKALSEYVVMIKVK